MMGAGGVDVRLVRGVFVLVTFGYGCKVTTRARRVSLPRRVPPPPTESE